MKQLTKSKYLTGLTCARSLWITLNKPELLPKMDLSTQYRFDTGYKIGELAKKLYPNGLEVPRENSLELSKDLLKKRVPLFEASFEYDRCFSRCDILVPVNEDEWDIVEVKSATKVKDENIHDVSFQKFVYENNGLNIRNCQLLIVNNEYFKDGELDLNNFFVMENLDEEIEEICDDIRDNVQLMLDNIDSDFYDEEKFGKHCDNPRDCPLPNIDWNFLPDNSVFTFYNIRVKKALDYYRSGATQIKDLSSQFELTDKQQIQKDCEINGKEHIDIIGIRKFLDSLQYPLYYIDFETYALAIPIYDKMKPYQRIPFQFSLHIKKDENSELEHYEFLANGKEDSRLDFISKLKELILDDDGSIITFNKSFEKGVLKELSQFLPEFKEWVESIDLRIVDLLDVFRNFYYYNSKQNGSCSIKKILPAIYPQKNHIDLEISDGMSASIEYENCIWGDCDEKEIEKIRKNLLEYCCLDTLAMVHIKEELDKLVK